jgi:hypothetical protein
MQIDRTNCMELILREFPAFNDQWRGHLESWNPIIARPIALDIAEFAEFTLKTIETGNDAEIDRLAATIELMLVEGDPVIEYVFRTMFLEQIADRSHQAGFPIERFTSKFQSQTDCYWQAVNIRHNLDATIHH